MRRVREHGPLAATLFLLLIFLFFRVWTLDGFLGSSAKQSHGVGIRKGGISIRKGYSVV